MIDTTSDAGDSRPLLRYALVAFKVDVESPAKFQCPPLEAERFSLPDRRDHQNEHKFKTGQGFIYYQHLRKAGGTGFCEMASRRVYGREVQKEGTEEWNRLYFHGFGYRLHCLLVTR